MVRHIFKLAGITATTIAMVATATAQQPNIIDDTDVGFSTTGTWTNGTYSTDFYGTGYAHANSVQNASSPPTNVATWQVPITETGFYNVAQHHTAGPNRAVDAPYTVVTDYGENTVRVDQRINGGQFNSIGSFHFNAGQTAIVKLGNNTIASSVVIADAVRLTRITTETAHNEYRFFWVSRYQWPDSNTATSQAAIRNRFQTAADNNFNAVFFQVRGQMDTYYPSPYEPWTSVYGWSDPGWNPLQYAIDQAHSRDIEFHAYFNTHTMTAPVPPSVTSPQHIYNLHGPGAPTGADRWDAHDVFGNPATTSDGYRWLSPGVPEASFHTRRELMHLVNNYDVDGVHFDRIRTSRQDVSYDPISVSRFEGDGNPDDLTYPEFMRDQITRDLRRIYGAVQASKPDVKISAAPIGISKRNSDTQYQGTGTQAWYVMNQDAWAWLKAHVMDFVVPQIYWETDSPHPHEKILADWLENAGGRWIVPGSRTAKTISGDGPKSLASLLSEWQTSVDQGAAGKCWWQVVSLEDKPTGEFQSYYEALKSGPYKNKVSPPAMPWKTNPTTGYITGYVRDTAGQPVVDARVKMEGNDFTYLTGWDGFFSILDVSPGQHALTATKYGAGSATQVGITVTAGDVASADINLNPRRGFTEFFRTRYNHEDTVRVRVFDQDLSGASVALVHVVGPQDSAGETIALAAEGSGKFSGEFNLQITPYLPGDGKLRGLPGNIITAQYLDADTGTGSGAMAEDRFVVRIPEAIICESRNPAGGVSATPLYKEITTQGNSWGNTPTVGPNKIVIKSMAPELNGLGGRTTNGPGGIYEFRPPVSAPGYYNVYVTIPGIDRSNVFVAPGTTVEITSEASPITLTADLSSNNDAVAGKWMLLAEDVPFDAGTDGIVRFINNNTNAPPTQQFSADAVKLEFIRPLGVNADVEHWQLFQ